MNKENFLNDLLKDIWFLNEQNQTNKIITHLENEEFDKLQIINFW